MASHTVTTRMIGKKARVRLRSPKQPSPALRAGGEENKHIKALDPIFLTRARTADFSSEKKYVPTYPAFHGPK